MGFLQFEGVGVSGMSACVPRRIIHNYEYTEFFSQAEVKEVVDKIGIVERRFVDDKLRFMFCCGRTFDKRHEY